MFYLKTVLMVAVTLTVSGCSTLGNPGIEHSTSVPEGYKLVWSDEFNGTELDTAKWGYRSPGKRRKAFNVKENVSFDGKGHLLLTTTREGDRIHTAMIGTQGRFQTTYGYFECRAKVQKTRGHWSAFWLQSPTFGKKIGDLAVSGAEIDIFECFDPSSGQVGHNVHWDGYGKHLKSHGTGRGGTEVKDLTENFHTFAVHWTPERYVFFVDGKESWRTRKGLSHSDEYIILSMEVGPAEAEVVMKGEHFADSITFDYVRVYKHGATEGERGKQ